jgi:hypothetical protein
VKRLAVVVAVGLTMAPATALAAGPSPDPAAMKKMLVNAPDGGWIESAPAPNTLEGPFDAQTFTTDVYDDAQTRTDVATHLQNYGFLGGYGRTFHKASSKAWIEEDVKSFDTKAGAVAFWTWMKSWLPEGADTTTPVVDTSAIPNSFGTEWLLSGFHATDTLFTKGAFMYDIVVGSDTDFIRADALNEARSAFEFAPAGDAPIYQQAPQPLAPSAPPPANGMAAAIAALVFVSLGACLIGGLIAAIFLVRRRPTPPLRTVLSPDGNYWWDGSSWQPVPRA